MEQNEIKKKLEQWNQKIEEIKTILKVDSKIEEINQLENIMNQVGFWDREDKEEIITKLSSLKTSVDDVNSLQNKIEEVNAILSLLESIEDHDLLKELSESVKIIEEELEQLEVKLLLSGPYDQENCILEVHSGAGGTEACDWANMLYRMYLRFCEKNNYQVELIDYQEGEETGIKSVSIEIKGSFAYGYLKSEKGVHRLVRLSPFDSSNRRHTSFASIDIMPIFKQVTDIEVNESDLKIDVYRASGAGGQHINTTDSAVRITHLPTKTVVTCQKERSQIKNRETALSFLKNKLKLLEIEKHNQTLKQVQGVQKNIEFGSQIRSYVSHPYSMVKDHRTNTETSNVNKVLDGDIMLFIESYLKGGIE